MSTYVDGESSTYTRSRPRMSRNTTYTIYHIPYTTVSRNTTYMCICNTDVSQPSDTPIPHRHSRLSLLPRPNFPIPRSRVAACSPRPPVAHASDLSFPPIAPTSWHTPALPRPANSRQRPSGKIRQLGRRRRRRLRDQQAEIYACATPLDRQSTGCPSNARRCEMCN